MEKGGGSREGGREREAAQSQQRAEDRQLLEEEKMPERNVILSALQNLCSFVSVQSPLVHLLVMLRLGLNSELLKDAVENKSHKWELLARGPRDPLEFRQANRGSLRI